MPYLNLGFIGHASLPLSAHDVLRNPHRNGLCEVRWLKVLIIEIACRRKRFNRKAEAVLRLNRKFICMARTAGGSCPCKYLKVRALPIDEITILFAHLS